MAGGSSQLEAGPAASTDVAAAASVVNDGVTRMRRGMTLIVIFVLALQAAAQERETPRRVLLLSADPHTSPGLLELELAVRRVLTASFEEDVELDVEHLDVVFRSGSELNQASIEMMRQKYSASDTDVVLAIGPGPLQFAVENRARVFPNAQILFAQVLPADAKPPPQTAGVGGIVSRWGLSQEANLILRLLPTTKQIVVVLGTSKLESSNEKWFRRDLAPFASKVKVDWWVGLPIRELEERVARLPPRTAILYISYYQDTAGTTYVPALVIDRISKNAAAPVFGMFANHVGNGIVGDGRISFGTLGSQLGELAVRVLEGTDAGQLGTVKAVLATPTFDSRELKRWQIDPALLPAGSQIRFEEPSLWQTHRKVAAIAVGLIVAEGLLLMVVMSQRLARSRAEMSEVETKSLYASVADSVNERVAILGREGTIVSANRAWREFLQEHAAGDLEPGRNYVQRVERAVERGQTDAARTLDALRSVLSGREAMRRLEYFWPGDGERGRYEMRIVSLPLRESVALVTVQDITDRWQSEERVRLALESLPFSTLLLDHKGTIALVNAEAEKLFGFARTEILGRTLGFLVPTFTPPSPSDNGHPHDTVKEGELTTGIRSDGSEVPLQLYVRMLHMTTRPMILVSMHDLSERRRLTAEVHRLREETAHFGRVAAVGEMSAAIAHELNQPLAGIMMNCQAAQRLLQRRSFAIGDVVETFADIVADARRAGDVIQRLRLMLRKEPTDVRALDLNEIVKQVQRLVANDLALKGAALDLELAADLSAITADRVHMQQVILNLLLNAADAMVGQPMDSRRMVLRTRPGMNRTIEIEVRDSGPGITAESMPHVFEPFYTTKPNGMGMGLSIVRSIIETHSGRITCSNAASGGAVFTISLPATPMTTGDHDERRLSARS